MSDTARRLADFLPRREAAAELDVCERTLDRWERLGEGPPVTKVGRRVLYRRSSLLAWLRGRERRVQGNKTAGEEQRLPSGEGA